MLDSRGYDWIYHIISPRIMGITRPGKLSHNELERSTISHGKINYFDWAIFNSKLFVYQRGSPRKTSSSQFQAVSVDQSGETTMFHPLPTIYPLVNIQKTMENHHFNGKINYKWPFSIANCNKLPGRVSINKTIEMSISQRCHTMY